MNPNKGKEGWHYFAVKKLPALFHGITSKHKGDFYCLNCHHSFRIENKLKYHEKVCKNKDFCRIVMPSKKDNILKFNQCMKSDKMLFIIYADIESLIKKIDGCANNPEKSSIKKIGEHILYGYLMWIIWAFDHMENKHNLGSMRDCKKTFCESLREHAKNISDFEEKKMLPLAKKY